MNTEVLFSSKSEMWETPQDFFDKLDEEFHFDLDVCATPENTKCKRYYTPEMDGLSRPWEGVCWCNPPYCRQTGKWVRKAHDEAGKGNCAVVMLLPCRPDVAWFHDYILGKAEIRFIRGRLKFGGSKNSAPFPSMVVVFRQKWNDMDYKELIKELKGFSYWIGQSGPESHDIHPVVCDKAVEAIETLLAERDAAQKETQDLQIQWDMYGGDEGVTAAFQKAAERDAAVEDLVKICEDNPDVCQYCKHMPCTGNCIGWQWRGPQKGKNNDQAKL